MSTFATRFTFRSDLGLKATITLESGGPHGRERVMELTDDECQAIEDQLIDMIERRRIARHA